MACRKLNIGTPDAKRCGLKVVRGELDPEPTLMSVYAHGDRNPLPQDDGVGGKRRSLKQEPEYLRPKKDEKGSIPRNGTLLTSGGREEPTGRKVESPDRQGGGRQLFMTGLQGAGRSSIMLKAVRQFFLEKGQLKPSIAIDRRNADP